MANYQQNLKKLKDILMGKTECASSNDLEELINETLKQACEKKKQNSSELVEYFSAPEKLRYISNSNRKSLHQCTKDLNNKVKAAIKKTAPNGYTIEYDLPTMNLDAPDKKMSCAELYCMIFLTKAENAKKEVEFLKKVALGKKIIKISAKMQLVDDWDED